MAEKTEITTTLGELVAIEPALRHVAELDGFSAKGRYHICKLAALVAACGRAGWGWVGSNFQDWKILI